MIYLLDTSAVLAHFRHEPGHSHVQALLEDHAATILIAAPVLLELDTALKNKGVSESDRREPVALYSSHVAETVPVDRKTAMMAIALREATPERLPTVDALIAGCALANDAILVHRDPHYDVIPSTALLTWNIEKTSEPPAVSTNPDAEREPPAPYAAGGKVRGRRKGR